MRYFKLNFHLGDLEYLLTQHAKPGNSLLANASCSIS